MAANMRELAKTDPEFYKYLAQNDPSLLEFGQDDSSSKKKSAKQTKDAGGAKQRSKDEDSGSEEEDASGEEGSDSGESEPGDREVTTTVLTVEDVERLCAQAGRGTVPLRRLVQALRAAVHSVAAPESSKASSSARFVVESADVFSVTVS